MRRMGRWLLAALLLLAPLAAPGEGRAARDPLIKGMTPVPATLNPVIHPNQAKE